MYKVGSTLCLKNRPPFLFCSPRRLQECLLTNLFNHFQAIFFRIGHILDSRLWSLVKSNHLDSSKYIDHHRNRDLLSFGEFCLQQNKKNAIATSDVAPSIKTQKWRIRRLTARAQQKKTTVHTWLKNRDLILRTRNFLMKVDTLNMGTHTPLLWCQHHVHALIFITNRVQRRFSLCNRKKGTNYSAVFYGCWLGPAQSTYTLSLSRIINPVPRGRLGAILSRMFAHRQFLLQQVNISLGCSNCCKYLYFVLYSFLSVYIWNILCSILTVCQTAPVFFLTRSHYEPIIVRDNSVESKKMA